MTKPIIKYFLGLLIIVIFSGCSQNDLGGSEIGNPPISVPRVITGTVTSSVNPSLLTTSQAVTGSVCAVDTVQATDLDDVTYSAEIDDECFFTLTVESDKVYVLEFLLDGVVLATLEIDNSSDDLESPYFLVSTGDSDIDLGTVTISGSVATPQNQPASFNDQDDDGIDDYTDNCIDDANADQIDTDGDDVGDACDDDDDGDGVNDGDDNCPLDANADQADLDEDGIGKVCDDAEIPVAQDQDDCIGATHACDY